VLKKPGDYWLRMLYLYPDHFPEDVLGLAKTEKRLLPYFDLPFQHASGRLLKLMGRRGDDAQYLDLIGRIRDTVPNAVVRSTFIVGFPGERDSDFQTLLDFQKKAKIDWMGVFTYSREEGTPAYRMQTDDAFELFRPQADKRKHAGPLRPQWVTSTGPRSRSRSPSSSTPSTEPSAGSMLRKTPAREAGT